MQRGNMQFLQALFSRILLSVTVLSDTLCCILETDTRFRRVRMILIPKGDARYVLFAVPGASAYWRLDRAIEAQ